jgi:hypothetical protein
MACIKIICKRACCTKLSKPVHHHINNEWDDITILHGGAKCRVQQMCRLLVKYGDERLVTTLYICTTLVRLSVAFNAVIDGYRLWMTLKHRKSKPKIYNHTNQQQIKTTSHFSQHSSSNNNNDDDNNP